MLRITVDDRPRLVTFLIEGRLEGLWVHELEKCWRRVLDGANRPALCVDLMGVTYIDAAGKARLAEMHKQGVRFIAGDCVTKAIVAEIVGEISNESVTDAVGAPSVPRANGESA